MSTAHVMVTLQLMSGIKTSKESYMEHKCVCSQGLQCSSLQDKQLASAHGDLAAQSSC